MTQERVRHQEDEVLVSIPISVLKELNYISGGKLTEESESSSVPELSAAAVGRSDRIICDKGSSRNNYSVITVKPTSDL